jgi:tetratricopeptide (TPR) repeat protein
MGRSTESYRPFLRDLRPRDAAWVSEVAALREGLAADRLAAMGQLGDLLRSGGALAQARSLLVEAVRLSEAARDTARLRANLIRLATVEFYDGGHVQAVVRLRALIATIERSDDPSYLDFALQHMGKALAEMGDYDEAETLFARALSLRSSPALRESSEAALRQVRLLRTGRCG